MKTLNQQNKKYSIIIPVYNGEKTIERCLDSIINQEIDLFEIIIINDESTDNTLKICQDYQKKYNNIKIINQQNAGPSVARNRGIKEAIGKYLIFVDADDFISETFFETIEKYTISDIDILKYNIKYHGNRVEESLFNTNNFDIDDGENILYKFIKEEKIFATPWMYIFNRNLFVDNNLFFKENTIHEDYGLIPCIIAKAKKIKGIDYIGYHYVYTENSLSTNQSYEEVVRRSFDMLVHYDFLLDFSKNISNPKIKEIFRLYILKNLLIKTKKLHGEELTKFNKQLTLRKIPTNGGK